MTIEPAALRRMTDEELVEAFQESKAEVAGQDPALTPPEDDPQSAIREEMQRRGLAPDREDLVPDTESMNEEPIVEDRA